MRRVMVAGNWKMNGSTASISQLVTDIKIGLSGGIGEEIEVIVFPPYVYLAQVEKSLVGSSLLLGAQNIDNHEMGAYTGEICGSMLVDFNCQYVIVGHSERRNMYHEGNDVITQKVQMAHKYGMKPILCVGETLEQRERDETFAIISQQLHAVLHSKAGLDAMQAAVIAYEPVWAIGTGVTASPEQAQEVHQLIRSQVAEYDSNLAGKIRIIYGGSVKADNASALFAMPDVDGGLVGGAALNANEFVKICHAALNSYVS